MQRNTTRSNLSSAAPALLACVMLTLTACSSDTEQSVDTPAVQRSTTTVEVDPDDWDATSCVWRWFDRWDITVVVPEGVAAGTSIALRAALYQDDVSSVGALGQLTVRGPGPAIVEMRVPPLAWLDPQRIDVSRGGGLSPPAGSMCEVDLATDQGPNIGTPGLSYDVDPPPPDGTTLGDLVAGVAGIDAPMFPLAALLWLQPEPAFDRLYLATDATLDSIKVERDGSCRSIASRYTTASVTQQHGCREPLPSEQLPGGTTITVPDENWAITVTGPEADAAALAAALQPIEVPGGEPADGPAIPGSDEWLDGYFADHPEITELARFGWREGKIAIVGRVVLDAFVDYLQPVVHGANANYGSSGQVCKAYTIGISSYIQGAGVDAPIGGYAWFVAHEPGTTFTVDAAGLTTMVPLQQAPSGEYVGFLDLGEAAVEVDQVAVTDSAGNPVPCIQ
jgi:hypothetical protein